MFSAMQDRAVVVAVPEAQVVREHDMPAAPACEHFARRYLLVEAAACSVVGRVVATLPTAAALPFPLAPMLSASRAVSQVGAAGFGTHTEAHRSLASLIHRIGAPLPPQPHGLGT